MLALEEVKAKSKAKIATLQEPLRTAATLLVEMCYRRGVHIIITEAFRTYDYQNYLYSKGRVQSQLNAVGLSTVKALPKEKVVTKARGGYSNHNWGYAFDFALLLRDGRSVSWDTLRDDDKDSMPDWDEVVIEAKKLGLEWGGDWRTFTDMPHLQWVQGITTAQFRQGKRPAPAAVTAAVKQMREVAGSFMPTPVEETAAVAYTFYSGSDKKNLAFMYSRDNKTIMYVQARDLAESIGVVAEWRNEDKQLLFNDRKIQDVKLIDGRAYMQLRPIAESYNKQVIFDKQNKRTGVAQ